MNYNPVNSCRFSVLCAGVMVYEHWSGDLFDERLVSDISLSNICVGIPVCLVSIDGCQIILNRCASDILVWWVSNLLAWVCVRPSCICV